LLGAGGRIEVGGSIGRGIQVETEQLVFASGARVQGPILYTSENEAQVAPGAQITQPLQRSVQPRTEPEPENTVVSTLRAGVGTYVLLLLAGVVMLALASRVLVSATTALGQRPLPVFVAGLVGVMVPPIALVFGGLALIIFFALVFGGSAVAGVAVIAIALLFLWTLMIILASVIVGAAIGHLLLRQTGRAALDRPIWWLALGLAIVVIVAHIPFIGPILTWIAIPIAGVGALIVAIYQRHYSSPGEGQAVAA
jgi:hypothetical protein